MTYNFYVVAQTLDGINASVGGSLTVNNLANSSTGNEN